MPLKSYPHRLHPLIRTISYNTAGIVLSRWSVDDSRVYTCCGVAILLRWLERVRRHRHPWRAYSDAGAPLSHLRLAGFSKTVHAFFVQVFFARKFAHFRRNTAARTDVRIRYTNQMIRGSKIMKLLAWEESFMATIFVRARFVHMNSCI